MGEKFAANPVTGTGSMTVPIPTSPGRSGFGPQLSLSYDSGAGNGPFGFGWSLSLPSIARKTDKGLPQYDDAGESDVYVLSGAEDLVPILEANGRRAPPDETSAPGYSIDRYRPRIEGLFARIERWTNRDTGELHWRSISRDNVTTLYGQENNSRIFDPSDPGQDHPKRIFSWLICASYDDKGNAIVYEYAGEDDTGIDKAQANERNRTRTANRYLKRIKYGNKESRLLRPDLAEATWLFEVVFDYDEGHYADLPLDPARPAADQHQFVRASSSAGGQWTVRPDPFSSYRSGFEVRTYRRCRRVLMLHRFAELGDEPYLVRATDFDYADLNYAQAIPLESELAHQGSSRFASFIRSITQAGFVRDGSEASVYLKRSLPPLELEYSKAKIQDEIRYLDAASAENLPAGVDGAAYQFVDLDGDGISGILTEQAGTCFYKPGLGEGRFGGLQVLRTKPSLFAMASGGTQLLDLSGDGQLDVVSLTGQTPGFYERTQDERWETFRTFRKLPNLRWEDPNQRFVDLDGDGHADVLITDDEVFTWYPSLAEDGFGPARYVRPPRDEEGGPRLVLADGTQSIYLADLCGDGLTDLVRVRNGEICYWPNLGYGRFGPKVTMDNAPWFDNPDQFDQRRVRLADIDGSGTTDIIYLHRNGLRIYFNQSGNRWSEARHLPTFPRTDNLSSISTVDLLGNGTACLVWSSPLPADARRPLRYIDLMGGQKPHLLVRSVNNLGAETHVQYAPSTKFYLADKVAGKPWITRLPFPVHVVERTTTQDRISGNRFVTRYSYHHGHFDGVEREFRGFGLVEQQDTEEFSAFAASGALPGASNVDVASHVPPILTKTWFHTGVYLGRDHVSDFFAGLLDERDAGEYYREPGLTDAEASARLLPDTIMPSGLTRDEEREACRALKGMMLRQEVYALDHSEKAGTPYTVAEQNFTVERLQARGDNRHAVFFAHPREALSLQYERKLYDVAGKQVADPRVSHAFTLEVDAFGNVLRSLAVAYGRRRSSTDPNLTTEDKYQQTRQRPDGKRRPLITYTLSSYTANHLPPGVPALDHHRTPLPAETRTYELTGFEPKEGAEWFTFEEWSDGDFSPLKSARDLSYELAADDTQKQKRLIEHVRTLYRKGDLSALSPLREVEAQALPGETYNLALTPALIESVFKRNQAGQSDEALLPTPGAILGGKGADQGGYVAADDCWWIPSGRIFFATGANVANPALTATAELSTARQHFFVPCEVADPFGQTTVVEYDPSDMLVVRTTDPVGNSIQATNDYRVLQPREVRDPNGNRTAAAFDALGVLAATAVMGKQGQNLGDLLEGVSADLTLSELHSFIADPHGQAADMLGKVTTRIVYDVGRFERAGQPSFAATLARETHHREVVGGPSKTQISFSYSDGFGREIQKKIQAEAGKAPQRQAPVLLPSGDTAPGDLLHDAQGALIAANAARRWVGTGRTVFNNKGKPVRKYEPFFSATHLYEPEREMTDTGVSPMLFYDPADRVVGTLHPNHTYEKVVFDPWRQTTFDVNDTVAAAGEQTGDPRTDPDIHGYVLEYFKAQPASWQTWHAQRMGSALGAAEQDSAQKAATHANTPTEAHLDALGRTFLTLAHNRIVCPGHALDGTSGRLATRVSLDIEGNQRAVSDAKDRVVMRYDYDLLSNRLHQASMEAGERWTLPDATGKPVRTWDSRGFLRRMTYDELRRPTGLFVTENGSERLSERTVYGEAQGGTDNHRGRVYQQFDGGGIVTSLAYDFKGNLTRGRRDLLPGYKLAVDWSQSPAATDGTFSSSTTYDALNRATSATSPDGSVTRPTFNEANLLDKVEVRLRGAPAATTFVANIDYDAKGQRQRIEYGNGAVTTYDYDPLTFRLMRLKTTRPAAPDAAASQLFVDPSTVQDLRYTYDPTGNLTRIEDAALKTVFRGGEQIVPVSAYTYDAIYRLVEARGREHMGQTAFDFSPPSNDLRDYHFVGNRVNPNDLQALRNYTERYEYDAVGNFEVFCHLASGSGWTRRYEYQEDSLIEAGKKSNRLTKTTVGNGLNHVESYTHDDHGSMTSMPHLAAMVWDFKDQLQEVDLGGGGTAYYVYDAAGQRVRKVIELQNGTRQKERLDLGGFEIYREFDSNGVTIALARETLHLRDDKQRIAVVETKIIENGNTVNSPAPVQRFYLGNHLGSASAELDNKGALISYEEYHAYGTTALQAGRSAAEMSLKRYRYSGKERDEESGFLYFGARYYPPWLARWASSDPQGLVDGPDTYTFANSSPLVFTDPLGSDIRYFQILFLGVEPTDQELNEYNNNPAAHNAAFAGAFVGVAGAAAAVGLAAIPAAAATATGTVKAIATAGSLQAMAIAAALNGETLLDVGNVAVASVDVVQTGGSAQSLFGLEASIVDLASGPNPLGEANSARVLSKKGSSSRTEGAGDSLPDNPALPPRSDSKRLQAMAAKRRTRKSSGDDDTSSPVERDDSVRSRVEIGDTHPQTGNAVQATIPSKNPIDTLVATAKPSARGLDDHHLENPGHHDPSGAKYRPEKSVLPADVEALFNESILFKDARYARDKSGAIHQFQESTPGVFHWAGSETGKTASGETPGLVVPPEVRRRLRE